MNWTSWSLRPSVEPTYSIIFGILASVGRKTTMLSLIGLSPTRRASRIPRRTGARLPFRIDRNSSGSMESTETLTLLRPASRSVSARASSIEPLVVKETSGICSTVRPTISSRSLRTRGSPPVNFTDRMPNSRATATRRSTSTGVISSPWGERGRATGPRPSS